MNLEYELENIKNQFKQKAPQEVQDLFALATKELEIQNLSENALKEEDTIPNGNLLDIHSKEVELYEYFKESDFIVLNFYRGGWCPYCNLELKAFQEIIPQLEKLNAKLIAISPQLPDLSLSTKEKNALEFEVLSDLQNKIAKKFGLVFSVDERVRPIYKEFGIDLPSSNADQSYEIPFPATYVVNKEYKIIYSFINEDHTKRAEPLEILKYIKNEAIKNEKNNI
jgi:peroxiredoxin